jgi:quercetin dioxygenase-like cupin family protein
MPKPTKHCTARAAGHWVIGSGQLNCGTRAIIRRLAIATLSLIALVTMSGFRVLDLSISGRDPHAVLSPLPTGHPQGNGATVSLESRVWASRLREPTISTFTLTLAPGGSAILHRTPSPGYVLVHVLSGTIRAQAWHARLGTYRASATWAEPASANDITAVNASASEPARAFVLVVVNRGD